MEGTYTILGRHVGVPSSVTHPDPSPESRVSFNYSRRLNNGQSRVLSCRGGYFLAECNRDAGMRIGIDDVLVSL